MRYGPDDLLTILAGDVAIEPEARDYFANERHVLALGTAFGEMRVVATVDRDLVYVRGETFERDFYGSGPSLSAAVRDYLESVEAFVAFNASQRPQRD